MADVTVPQWVKRVADLCDGTRNAHQIAAMAETSVPNVWTAKTLMAKQGVELAIRSMPRNQSKPLSEAEILICRRYEKGDTTGRLSEVLGIGHARVVSIVERGRRQGYVTRRGPNRADTNGGRQVAHALGKAGVRVGCMASLVGGLTPDVIKWLKGECLSLNMTVAEWLTGIVNDEYFRTVKPEENAR